MKFTYTFILIILLLSCNYSIKDLGNITKVDKLEILAIKLDKPEGFPNEEINAQMLIGEPSNYKNKEYHKVWLLCDPDNHGESESGLNVCSSNDISKHIKIISSDVDRFTFKVSYSSLSNYNLNSKYIYIIGGICIDSEINCKKYLENISQKSIFNNNKFKISFKRFRLLSKEHSINNINPQIESIFINNLNITDSSKVKYNNENNYIIKMKLTNNSFDGGAGNSEFISIYWRANFGKFTKYKTNQFYNSNNIEINNLIIDEKDKTLNNKKIYILIFNLRGGVNYKEIYVN